MTIITDMRNSDYASILNDYTDLSGSVASSNFVVSGLIKTSYTIGSTFPVRNSTTGYHFTQSILKSLNIVPDPSTLYFIALDPTVLVTGAHCNVVPATCGGTNSYANSSGTWVNVAWIGHPNNTNCTTQATTQKTSVCSPFNQAEVTPNGDWAFDSMVPLSK